VYFHKCTQFEYSVVLRSMETPGNVEIDPYADNIVPVSKGEEHYQEAVDELPQDQGLDGEAGPGTPSKAGDGQDGPPHRAQLVWTHTRGKPWEMAASPQNLDPLWALYRKSRKLAPHCLFRIRSYRLRFSCNHRL